MFDHRHDRTAAGADGVPEDPFALPVGLDALLGEAGLSPRAIREIRERTPGAGADG